MISIINHTGMLKMKISIIIPAYNTEIFISDCIHSVLSSKYENIEIIAINDGSDDNTGKILDSFQDKRLRVIHTENNGQSSARNYGLTVATGEYIIFLDSDDKLADGAIDNLVSLIINTKADIILFSSAVFFEDDSLSKKFNPTYERKAELCNSLCSGVDFFKKAITHGNYIVSPCLYISNRKAIYGLSFKDGIIHEDNIYTTRLLLENDVVTYCTNSSFYLRRVRHGSIMTQEKGNNHIDGYYNCVNELLLSPPKNSYLAGKDYVKFISHMVDCLRHTSDVVINKSNDDFINLRLENESKIAQHNQEISNIKNSTSWRVTYPLRKVKDLVKGGI